MNYRKYHQKLQNIQESEKIYSIIRKSFIAYILNTFFDLSITLIGGGLVYISWIWLIYGDLKIHLTEFLILLVYWLIVITIWFLFWYKTYLIITTHRIEKHKLTSLFGEKKEILRYHEINKISYTYPSFLAKILNYGTIEITAGEKNDIIFPQAPKPEQIVNQIKKFIKNKN